MIAGIGSAGNWVRVCWICVVFIRIARSLLGVPGSLQLGFDQASPLPLRINLLCHIDGGLRGATSSVPGSYCLGAEAVTHDEPSPVDDARRRRSLESLRGHRPRDRAVSRGPIDSHRESNPILVQESFERDRRHGGVMLEHAMQAQHHEIVATARNLVQPLGLRDGLGDAIRTQHLEGMENHYLAAQRFQRQRRVACSTNVRRRAAAPWRSLS